MPTSISRDRALPRASVQMIGGRATLIVDDQPVAPMAYTSSFHLTQPEARLLVEAGLKVYFLWIDSGWHNTTSWDEVGREARAILDADPQAYIVLRTATHPPESWLDDHPEELETFEDGQTGHFRGALVNYFIDSEGRECAKTRMVCLASQKMAADCGRHLVKLIDHVESSDWGHRVIGYFLIGGGTGEWLYPMAFDLDKHCIGFSPAFKRFYGKWLGEKYGSVQGLRRAWGDDDATFDEPHIPRRDERLLAMFEFPHEGRVYTEGDWGTFLDPRRSQRLADFYEARTAGTAAAIEHMAKVIKQRTDGRALVGAFWGNLGCTYYHCNSVSGPMFLARSPVVDFLSSPGNYEDRVPGGGATFRAAVDSLSYRGKLWINESDSRTYRSTYGSIVGFGGTYTLEESLNALKRDFAQVLCDDVDAFWFDMQPGENSIFFHDPEVRSLVNRQQALAEQAKRQADTKKASEIAVVYDQDSIWYVDQETSRDLLSFNRTLTIPRIGAPCDHIFHDDFELGNLPEYRMYVFVNCFHLGDADRERIEATVKRDGKTAVWVYAPGLLNPDATPAMSMAHMRTLTAFTFDAESGPREASFRVQSDEHPLTRGLSPHLLYGRYERPILNTFDWKRGEIQVLSPSLSAPLFSVADAEATCLGRFVANDRPAYAVRDFDSWRSVYLGAKVLNPDILRAIARAAGVHVYLDTNDVVYANRRYVAVHATTEDTKTIALPRTFRRVTDAYNEEVVAEEASTLRVAMKAGETRMFALCE